ncbi:MAG: serine/threonine-protein phosphatase [Bacteroidetes bacterium]|nr:serine/threonine-protein phosphatase [Bacteroidota bacterium]
MLRLLDIASEFINMNYRLGDRTVREAMEELLSNIDASEQPDWCPTETTLTERQSIVSPQQSFVYRPHRFAEMDINIEKAHKLQYALLPKTLPENAPCHLSAVLESYCHLSGDLFGWRMGDDGALKLWLLDMSGHGLRAGLLSALLKLLIDEMEEIPRLEKMISELNRRLRECLISSTDVLYATGVFLSLSADHLHYLSAAHPPFLLINGGGLPQQCESTGRPLGVFADGAFSARDIELAPGSRLLLYTDGIIEAKNDAGEEFGVARLADAFATAPNTAAATARHIYDTSAAFQDMQMIDDDVTFIAVNC